MAQPNAKRPIILAVNAGSSSVKVSVYQASTMGEPNLDPNQLAYIEVSGLSAPPPGVKYTRRGQKVDTEQQLGNVDNQEKAFGHVLSVLLNDNELPELSHREEIDYVCHRIVHGGDYGKVQIIDRSTYHHLQQLSDLAPL